MSTQSSDALQGEIHRLKLDIHDLRSQQGTHHISIGNYILTRLEQLGVTEGLLKIPTDSE
ncbi:hypothetical protein H0H81_001474 [Sphagnurus paluster]|uniref:Uncharacterized protein n=1 Tax=Sphagnurus paluster TaxID=117069 RepID=A0A9P7FT90_9AGAR|nr:hypothetical protein H0H81_001474 [Sphagnurus paluster]